MKPPIYTDQDLIVAMQNGDEKAFEELYNRYWPEVYTMIYRRIGDKDTTKDIVQNIFINLWLSRDKVIAENSLAPLLNATAKRKAISWYKQNLAQKQRESHYHTETETPVSTAHNEIETRELQDVLDQEIQKMPDTMQQSFRMSRYEHKTTKEIAAALSLSEQTVRNNISMALERLRTQTRQFYSEPANLAGILAIILTKI